jgi:putative flippase GtrA
MSRPVSESDALALPRPTWTARLLTLVRSSMVGICATASDLITTTVLVRVFDFGKREANIPGLIPGLVIMFFGNKIFAFQDQSKNVVKQGSLFLLIEAIALALNVLLFDRLVVWFDLHETLARLIGTNITYLGFSFPMWALFVFRRKVSGPPDSTNSTASR